MLTASYPAPQLQHLTSISLTSPARTLFLPAQEALAVLRPLNHDQFVTMLTNFYRGLKGECGLLRVAVMHLAARCPQVQTDGQAGVLCCGKA